MRTSLSQCFLLGGGWWIRDHTLAPLGGKNRGHKESRIAPFGSCIGGLTIDPPQSKKALHLQCFFAWWGMVDS